MKTNQENITPPPSFTFEKKMIIIENKSYHSILFDQSWHLTPNPVSQKEDWLSSPLRKPVLQLISWPNAQISPQFLDSFWDKGISIEILSPPAAINQAKSLIANQHPFQLLILGA